MTARRASRSAGSLPARVQELRRRGRSTEAIARLKRHRATTGDDHEAIELQRLLGELLSETGQHREAEAVLQRAHDLAARSRDRVSRALAAAALAENLRRQRGAANQLRALEVLAEAESRLTRRAGLARCRIALAQGRIHLERRDYSRAFLRLDAAWDLAGARATERAATARSMGLFFGAVGRTSLARRWFERALETQASAEDWAGQARSCAELGRVFLDRGEPAAARDVLRRGLVAARRLGDPYHRAHILNDLGRAEAALGRDVRAEALLRESLEVSQREELALVAAFAHKNLAKLSWRAGRPEDALHQLDQEALPRFQELDNAFGLAVSLRDRGRILRDLGQEIEAAEALEEARRRFEAADALRQVASTDCDRARLLADRLRRDPGQTAVRDAAIAILDGALSLARSLADPRQVDRIANLLEEIDVAAAVKRHVADLAGRERESHAVVLGGHKEVLTVLSADLQGFSAYSADKDPHEVLTTLNEYFSALGEVIEEHDGTVDKYIGDGLMVLFRGDAGGHHPYRAVRAALAMRQRLRRFNRERRAAFGLQPLKTRIGINTGEAVVGNTGSYERMQFTAIGSAINLAFRLEDRAGPDRILVGPDTFRHLGGHFETRPVPPFIPKGFEHEITAYEVLAVRDLVRFRPGFVTPAAARPRAGVLLLGLGGRVGPGVIDRSASPAASATVAARIYREPYLVLDAFPGVASIQHTAVHLPRPPDLDTIVSAFFAQELVERGVLPNGARELADYLERLALLLLPDCPAPWNTPWGLAAGLFERDRRHPTLPEEGDLYRLQRGIYLAEFLCTLIQEGGDLLDPDLLAGDHPFEQERERLRSEDQPRLAEDLDRARRGEVRVPTRTSSRRKSVAYLALEAPCSAGLWVWARGLANARTGPARRPGLLIVERGEPRHVLVSLDPASGATLERLGDNLNRAEREARATRDLRDAADGWLTLGYGGLPGVALEAPADGTVLSLDEILSALGRRRRPLR